MESELIGIVEESCQDRNKPLKKKIFYKKFFIFTEELKVNIQNRAWHHPNWKWIYYSHLQTSDKKNFCYKMLPSFTKSSNLLSK